MKKLFIAILCCFAHVAMAQKNQIKEVPFDNEDFPILIKNGEILDVDNLQIYNEEVFFGFSDKIQKSAASNNLLANYINVDSINREEVQVIFYFTDDKVKTINVDELQQLTQNPSKKILFQVNKQPLSSKLNELNQLDKEKIADIKYIKDFDLKQWKTGKTDEYSLVWIKMN